MTIAHAIENLKKHLRDGSTVYFVIRRDTSSGNAVSVYTVIAGDAIGGDMQRITHYAAIAGGFDMPRDCESLIVNGGCSYIVDAIEAATGLKNLKYHILT